LPFLLTLPNYSGTLAAARCLGRRGIPVIMAGSDLLAPGRWSRHIARRVDAPDVFDTELFFRWLMDFGRREPGHVLYPTCDDLAWLFAARADELRPYFQLYQPGAGTILNLLDKEALHRACEAVGIGVVPTAFPRSHAEALQMAGALTFPLLIKPRTQILLPGHGKGTIVDQPEQFRSIYERFVAPGFWPPASGSLMAGVEIPMLQSYLPQANDGIYSVAGFIARGGTQAAARASRKTMQRPRRVGVGLCFEEAPVDPALLASLLRLCARVGYFGAFEAEFVVSGGQHLLIDFNPRFYGQMGFEVARGLPTPYLVWLAARGEDAAVDQELAEARAWREGRGYAYCDRFFLNLGLWAQGLTGRIPLAEMQRWRHWQRERREREVMVDAVRDPDDRMPGMVAALGELYRTFRHPRTGVLTILGGS
jgi:D-aspartate ligase